MAALAIFVRVLVVIFCVGLLFLWQDKHNANLRNRSSSITRDDKVYDSVQQVQQQGNDTLSSDDLVIRTGTSMPRQSDGIGNVDTSEISSDSKKNNSQYNVEDATKSYKAPLAGGVIVFYHIYKTGGTTIRQDFAALEGIQMNRVRKGFEIAGRAEQIENVLSRKDPLPDNQTYFLEMHIDYPAPKYPTILEFEPYLNKWRELSRASGVPFFSFALVRDPIDYAVSYFNFFYSREKKYAWSPYYPMNATEENFLSTFVPNRQTRIMGAEPAGTSKERLTTETYYNVKRALCLSFDWVGTTENMQAETLPLLAYLVKLDEGLGSKMEKQNVGEERELPQIHRSDLSATTLQMVEDGSKRDREIYNAIVKTFPIHKMQERFGFAPAAQRRLSYLFQY